jgi:hypothetical protein
MAIIQVSKAQAQNFLLNRSFLASHADLQTVLKSLSCIQVDPISVVAKSHELALFNRVTDFTKNELTQALYEKRTAFEYWLQLYSILPIENYSKVSARRQGTEEWHTRFYTEHKDSIDATVAYITKNGPTSSKDLEHLPKSRNLFSWSPSGSRTALLEYLWDIGEVMISFRKGQHKHYDLTSRVASKKVISEITGFDESVEWMFLSNFSYLGLVRKVFLGRQGYAKKLPFKEIFQKLRSDGVVEQVVIDGVKAPYFIHARDIDGLLSAKENNHKGEKIVNFLSPLDPFIIDRKMLLDIFDFSYTWEAYVPAIKRKFGYYGLPVLMNGEFVGQVEFTKTKEKSLEIKNSQLRKLSSTESKQFDQERQRLESFVFGE